MRFTTWTVVALIVAPHAGAQEPRMRRAAEGGAPPTLPNVAPDGRVPFVGAWIGWMTIERDTMPVAMTIERDGDGFSGGNYMPDGGRAPHLESRLNGTSFQWQQQNSGGGRWIYDARVSNDSLIGTVVLRGAPWNPSPEPSGRFLLVRHPTIRRRQ